jgi:outer membrane lipoprotein LolB
MLSGAVLWLIPQAIRGMILGKETDNIQNDYNKMLFSKKSSLDHCSWQVPGGMKFIIFGIMAILLSGCAFFQTSKPTPHPSSWKARATQLKQIKSWTAIGSVSIQHDGKANLASIRWEQKPNEYELIVYGPLGFGKVMIQGKSGIITLTQSSKPPLSAETPENLMQNELGWYVPISNLYYWIRGLPSPHASAKTTFDSSYHLISLAQENWQINYLAYTNAGNIELPSKIEFSTNKLKIKWVIKDWVIKN